MSFGRNPHVAKAEAAEQKALCVKDDLAREQAWREAARFWDRASERETDAGRRQQYLDKAELARAQADAPSGESAESEQRAEVAPPGVRANKPSALN